MIIDKMNPLAITIEGRLYRVYNQYVTGEELKHLANIPLDTELYLAVRKPFDHELIENTARVNLARPGIEQFFVKKKLHYFINENQYTSYKQWVSGAELRIVGNIPENEDIYLLVDEGWQNDFIEDNELVDLARQGKERFYTKDRECTIYVNTKPFEWKKRIIRYEDVINLAFGNINVSTSYTITYSKGIHPKEDGFLVEGQIVDVKHKMQFDVTATTKS
ncbi:hypothetical protein E2605_09720 [Dysgonomonas capnocytophagoides]|uniref:Multi-ubiquitin domain-containing protein n=1 Tax=Dysgonomonas capnocytophagoides TaxID=45254 RepID=A0A4Y8L2Q9_9BACT|nr:multiubiquitin domain-containing protein [Dysgonomonas capnocytophagoides]TFD96434.1 hypothetical protein E2605_09720 [Dysgonomonas capnocytophagoides]